MTEYRREGKHTVRPGDTVKVSSAVLPHWGIKDRGWTGKVLRLIEHPHGPLAEVTRPDRAATRIVRADRLTRQKKAS